MGPTGLQRASSQPKVGPWFSFHILENLRSQESLGVGAALALPPLPFPDSWYLPPATNSGQTSSRPAEPARLSPAWLWPWDPGACYPAVAEEGETLCQKLFTLIATQFASTSMWWATPLCQAAERVPALGSQSGGQRCVEGSFPRD